MKQRWRPRNLPCAAFIALSNQTRLTCNGKRHSNIGYRPMLRSVVAGMAWRIVGIMDSCSIIYTGNCPLQWHGYNLRESH